MRYYSVLRPISPGTIPTKGLKSVVNYEKKKFVCVIGRDAWGYVEYDAPLDKPDDYDLVDENCLKRHVKITRLERNLFSLDSPLLKGKETIMEKKEALAFIKSNNCTYEFI